MPPVVFLLFLLDLLFFLLATGISCRSATASATTAGRCLHNVVHASVSDHLGEEHWNERLHLAACICDQLVQRCRADFSTIIMQSKGCINADELLLLFFSNVCNWDSGHGFRLPCGHSAAHCD